jgi:hypothetical protein
LRTDETYNRSSSELRLASGQRDTLYGSEGRACSVAVLEDIRWLVKCIVISSHQGDTGVVRAIAPAVGDADHFPHDTASKKANRERLNPPHCRQVASLFRVTSAAVATWARRGRLAEVRHESGKPRYRRADVEALLRSRLRRRAR